MHAHWIIVSKKCKWPITALFSIGDLVSVPDPRTLPVQGSGTETIGEQEFITVVINSYGEFVLII